MADKKIIVQTDELRSGSGQTLKFQEYKDNIANHNHDSVHPPMPPNPSTSEDFLTWDGSAFGQSTAVSAMPQSITNPKEGDILLYSQAQGVWTNPPPIVGTGGNLTKDYVEDGKNYRAHIFTSSGTFECSGSGAIQYLVVAGGGGGAGGSGYGGAGGAGAMLLGETSITSVSSQEFNVIVGGGGARNNINSPWHQSGKPLGVAIYQNGGNSRIELNGTVLIESMGGGGGSFGKPQTVWAPPYQWWPRDGGSGGGQGHLGTWAYSRLAKGTLGGNDGGAPAGGGSGAAGSGSTGGIGLPCNYTGDEWWYAGGGSGTNVEGGRGGGGGGMGALGGADAYGGVQMAINPNNGGDGAPHSGGGGGASSYPSMAGGNGGSGIVVIRYLV